MVTLEEVCTVCSSGLTEFGRGGGDYQYDCPNCGRFTLAGSARAVMKGKANSTMLLATLAHTIRRMQRANGWPMVTTYTIQQVEKEARLPDPAEQAENFVLWLGGEQTHPGERIKAELPLLRARVGAVDRQGVKFILRALQQEGLVQEDTPESEFRLSFKGWELYHRLTRGTSGGARAFMAMDFNDRQMDDVFANCFKPAVAQTGFDLRTLREDPKMGLIDERMRVEIRRSRFVVADLTHGNHGAYFEAGMAEGIGLPVVYTCRANEFKNIHFDASHLLAVKWDPDDLSKAAEELKTIIRATLPEEAQLDDPEAG
jgi:hypothetical protein